MRFKFLGVTLIGLLAFTVTLAGLLLTFETWAMLAFAAFLWMLFLVLLVHALKPV